ncbi:MAG: DUF726 domain-containing protein [Methylococcus sp.]|nr:DUF726 domain-containing protein [Methylococcus sp.]
MKVAQMGGLSLASAAVFGPLAFYMAPSIGGAIGVSMGYSGAVATNVGLATLGGGALAAGGAGMAGGVATITGLGGVLGGGLGAYISSAYQRSVKDFSIEKVRDGCDPALITINGFLSKASDGYNSWTNLADSCFKDHAWYHVNWDAKNLADLGKSILSIDGDAAITAILKKAAISASKASAKRVLLVSTIYEAVRFGRNPWHVALRRAENTGFILSDLLRRCKQKEFVLVGHSLGCRVIRSCLQTLSDTGLQTLSDTECKIIRDVHLLGGAVGNGTDSLERASKVVSGKIYNYKSNNDMILKTLYRPGTFFASNPIGLHSIDVRSVQNIDVTKDVDGHMKYKDVAHLFCGV